MRKRDSPFVYPYNLGFFKNIRQVLFDPVTDGISWPVIEGCDQFTLTVSTEYHENRNIMSIDFSFI